MASTIVITTVMHRSGISLVTNILQMAGLNVGHNLLGETESNPHGHFEDLDFSNLQDSFLTNRGYNYLCLPSADIECMSSKGFGQIRDQIERGFQVPNTFLRSFKKSF